MKFKTLLLTIFIGLSFMATPPANANTPSQTLTYNVYAGGLKTLKAIHTTTERDDITDINIDLKLSGFFGRLFPWSGLYTSSFKRVPNSPPTPITFTSKSAWNGKERTRVLNFDNTGKIDAVIFKKSTGDRRIDVSERKELLNAVDMMSGLTHLFETSGAVQTCDQKIPVFDGKRSFEIAFTNPKMVTLSKSKYNLYEGDALRCDMVVTPLSGFSEKDLKKGWMAVQNQSKKNGKPPQIWLARPDGFERSIPVRLQLKSNYGAVIAHLSQIDRAQ